MCGIYGYVGFEEEGLLDRMALAQVHRGPDGEGSLLIQEQCFALGLMKRVLAFTINIYPAADLAGPEEMVEAPHFHLLHHPGEKAVLVSAIICANDAVLLGRC